MKNVMRALAIVAMVGLLGCLPFGLGDPEQSKVDQKLVGLWLSTDPKEDQLLWTVSQYDAKTYLVTQYSFKRTDNTITAGERASSKAWTTDIAGKSFITLQLKTADEFFKQSKDVFMVAQLVFDGDSKITAMGISPDFVGKQPVDNAEKFAKFVTENVNDANMYLDAMKFEKLSKDRYPEAKKILKAFGEDYGE